LTSGFISLPRYCSTATIELNTWPVASTPTLSSISCSPDSWNTRAMVKTLEIDWIEKVGSMSPAVDGSALRRGQGDAEIVRGHLGQGGDVVGVLALVEALELVVGGLDGHAAPRSPARAVLGDGRPPAPEVRPEAEAANPWRGRTAAALIVQHGSCPSRTGSAI
jgi:hypothetical protein